MSTLGLVAFVVSGLLLLIVPLAILVFIVLFVVAVYNGLVQKRIRCQEAWSQIDVQLKRRYDLIPNLVETVKGYAAHERGTLEAVTQARNAVIAAPNPEAQAKAENMLTGALRQIFALAEAYPDLKANQNFLQLQAELSDLENKIAASRRFFNNAVQEYNTATQAFPAVLFAGALGFTQRTFFEVDEGERAAIQAPPQVKF
jgi:LemA protein